jgi:peptidoglycan/xylan/chitin deacetylase (PgdA/CDA1 family)
MKSPMTERSRVVVASVVLGGLLAAGSCAAPAWHKSSPRDGSASSSVAAPGTGDAQARPVRQRAADTAKIAAAARRWGLHTPPIAAPPPPAVKPALTHGPWIKAADGLPPVVFRVPTHDRVVFLTIDDGDEKDPKFSRMMRELHVPFSAFLTGDVSRTDYGYFRDLKGHGNGMHNHTSNHRDLRRLDHAQQRAEICNHQDELAEELGTRPRLFRPPYGEYNEDSLRAAASCGITTFALWNEEVFPDRMEYSNEDRLRPGDIILTHFRGTSHWNGSMTDMVRRLLDTATAQGFAVARLEDYL